MTTVTFTSSGSWVAPSGVSAVDCQCWGEGGTGANGLINSRSGGGGGGGEYAEEASLAVTAGSSYSYTIGAGGSSVNTSFPGDSVTVTAHHGNNGSGTGAGGGGFGSASTIHFTGGNGAAGTTATNRGGGGGGSSAGTAAGGAGGGTTTSSVGGSGGTAPSGGGGGGDGGNATTNGHAGSVPGGGGGGGGDGINGVGGTGASGQISLTYSAPVSGTATLSGAGTLTASGGPAGTAALSGAGTLTAVRAGAGNATLPGAGTLTANVTQQVKASMAGAGTLTASGGPPAPAVVNQWANSYGQGTTFGSITSALQSCVVPLTPTYSVGVGSGTPTPGNWLFCIASWTQDPQITAVHTGVGDDIHSWWREFPASSSSGNVRTSVSYTPNIARTAGNVYVAPDMEIAAINVLVIEVSGLGPWDTVTGTATGYATGTSLNLALAAPGVQAFFIAGFGGGNASSGQAFAPAGWTTLDTLTQTNGSNALADNILTSAVLPSSSSAQSVTATAASAEDISGFLLGVRVTGTSPVPASQNPAWPYVVAEAGFGAGFNTPDSEITWSDITSRVWNFEETTGVQFQLGQVQASSVSIDLDNNDGALSPGNPGSPYYSNALNSNMSFQSGTSPWAAWNGTALAQSSAFAYASALNAVAQYSMKVTPDGVTANPGALSEFVPVSASTTYTASAQAYSAAGWAPGAAALFAWYTSGQAFISFSSSSAVALAAGTWTQASSTAASPPNAAYAKLLIQFSGTPSAPFYLAEGAMAAGSSAVSTGRVTSGVPVRLRAALGTFGGTAVNRWYVIQRNILEWGEELTSVLRRICAVTGTDLWASMTATPPSFYRSEVYEDAPYTWYPLDDQPGNGGVLPTQMLNAAVGNSAALTVAVSPLGTGPTTAYGTDGYSFGSVATPLPFAQQVGTGLATYTAAALSGWMYGDPPGSAASLGTGNPVNPSPGSAAWQMNGATGNTGSYGWYMSARDAGYPDISSGITVEAWANYACFGSQSGATQGGSFHVYAQQPYCPLTILELATDSAPAAILQLDISGHLNLITYNSGTGTSHSIYSGSDLRDGSWFMVTMTLTGTSWHVLVNGGATADVSGSATVSPTAWTWLIINADMGTGGGNAPGSIVHGGNAAFSHVAVYPCVLPYYRIMDHYWAAVTAFGLLPAPAGVSLSALPTPSGGATPNITPDGQQLAGSYGYNSSLHTNTGFVAAAVVQAQAGGYTSGASAWASLAALSQGTGDAIGVSWSGLAAQYAVYTSQQVGGETQAAVTLANQEVFSSGYGATAAGYGIGQAAAGNGSSPAAASVIGDAAGERIERLMRAGRCASPNRCIDPAPLLVQAPGTSGGGTQTGPAVQAIAESDGGMLYVDNLNHLTYWQRPHLAAQYSSPAWQIGPSAGKIPYYRDIKWVTDPQRIWNVIEIAPFSPSGAQLPLITPAGAKPVLLSQIRYGAQSRSITSWLQSAAEMQNQANWLFTWFGQAQRRAENVKIEASANPAYWQLVMGINVGDVVTLEDFVIGGGGSVYTMRVTQIRRKITFGSQEDVTGYAELTLDFEPSSWWT